MKVIIDLIEDIRAAINNDKDFSLMAMSLKEENSGGYRPSWESYVCRMKVDDEQSGLFLFLGKEDPLTTGQLLQELNSLSNEKMMYEVCVSYSKQSQRINSPLIGFGESLNDRKYLLFISEQS